MPSETEAGEEDEVDVCAVERIPALCSRYKAQTTALFITLRLYNARCDWLCSRFKLSNWTFYVK